MPAALVATTAETTGIDVAEAERRWKLAKSITEKETGLNEGDGEPFWKYTTGVFKKSMGIGAVMESADICGEVHTTYITPYLGKPHVNTILESASAEEVHAAAHEAATSHLNDLPEPTQAQLEAGTYKKGHIRMHGLDISIENPKGSKRSGIDPDGTPWEVTMPYTYGYFRGEALAIDGDHVDCIIGDHPESELVFAVDQVCAETGRYDEPKIVLGTLAQKEARDLYISGFSDGKGGKRLGAMTALHMPDFKAWLRGGETTKPLSDAVLESAVAPRTPLWATAIRNATSFDDIAKVFMSQWPGLFVINRLTNKSDGSKVEASNKEGAMKNAVEVSRHNVTVAEFFRIVKAACEKKGLSFDLDRDTFENPPVMYDDTYTVRDGIKYARYGKGEPTREYDGSDAGAKAETYRVKPYDYQCYILNHDGSVWNESCEFTFDDEKRGYGYYYQASTGPTSTENPDRAQEQKYQLLVRVTKKDGTSVTAGSDDFSPSRSIEDAIAEYHKFLRGVETGLYPEVSGTGSAWIEDENGKVVNESLPEPEPEKPAVAIPKNPKTGPQRVAVLRSMAADIPGMQDYFTAMDAATTKKEVSKLDRDKYELIPGLRGSDVKIGGLDLYWTVADLRDMKEREINKRLKEEALAAKVQKEQVKTEKKAQEDLTLKRHKERPELKKVLDLISADFRTEIIESITARFTRMVEKYFTDGLFNLQRPERGAPEWEQRIYANTAEELAPLMVPTRALNPDWKKVMERLAKESADFYIMQFENKMAWKLGDVLERKGGGEVALSGNVRDHAIRLSFPDNSGFQVRTQQVISTSVNGKVFARYPTTFHNVTFASGEKMNLPSAAKMQKEFGLTEDKTGA